MKPIKKVALVHSLCSVGKASMTNMIPILSAMGVEVCPIPTVLLSTHTGGYGLPTRQTVEISYLRDSAAHFAQNDVQFDVIFVGYLGSIEMAEEVLKFIENFPKAKVIVDPIMGDHGTFYGSLGQEYADSYLKLCKRADLILPNLTEACFLNGTSYESIKTLEDVTELGENLYQKGIGRVVLTSIPAKEGEVAVATMHKGDAEVLSFPKAEAGFHGTGDAFDAVLIGSLLKGKSLKDAVTKAHAFTAYCIRESAKENYPKREGLMIEKCLSLLV